MATEQKYSIESSLKKLFVVLHLERKDIYTIYMLAILAGLVQLSLPLGIQTIIGFVMAGNISTSIYLLITLVVIGTFCFGLLQVRQMQIIERIEQKLFVRYSIAFTDRLPKLNVEKLDKYYLPELVNRYFETISLQKGIEKLLIDIPSAFVQIIFGVILLAFYHPAFIGFGITLLLILFFIIRFTSLDGLITSIKASDYKYEMTNWIQEVARVIKQFKYAKTTSLHLQKSDEILNGYLKHRTKYFKILLTQYWSLVVFKILITGGILILGTVLLLDQKINIGQFVATDIVILTILNSIEKLVGNLEKVYDALTSIEKISKIIDAPIESSGTLQLQENGKGISVVFKDVYYKYNNENETLNNINFKVSNGESLLINGHSGAGKSTILRLLSGAYSNFNGNILINDVPIGNYDIQSLRDKTGILLQHQEVFHATLLENITMGNTDISSEEILNLAKITGLSSYIETLTNGFDTLIDHQGKKLTNKVVKNIALMRALLGNKRLLLLESPFDHLNSQEIIDVFNYIKAKKNCSVIIVSQNDYQNLTFNQHLNLLEGSIKA